MEPNIYSLGVIALIAAAVHLLQKIGKVNSLSDGDCNYRAFFKKEWPYMASSLLTIIAVCLAHENIAKLKYAGHMAGDWMYLVFAVFGWFSDSLMYMIFGKLEKKVTKDLKATKEGRYVS